MTYFLDQEERERAVKSFREQKKDVLVATDVASKGLDFLGIKHVINYDMPDDIENYGKPFAFYASLLCNHYYAITIMHVIFIIYRFKVYFQYFSFGLTIEHVNHQPVSCYLVILLPSLVTKAKGDGLAYGTIRILRCQGRGSLEMPMFDYEEGEE